MDFTQLAAENRLIIASCVGLSAFKRRQHSFVFTVANIGQVATGLTE